MSGTELVEEKFLSQKNTGDKEENQINNKRGININIILFAIFISIIIILYICLVFKQPATSKNIRSSSSTFLQSTKTPKKLEEIIVIPYETPFKKESLLDYILYPYHSDILRNLDDYEFIRDTLGKISLKMVFNSHFHGDYAIDVQSRSKYHHTLVLIETENGNRFGGYTSDNFTPETFGLTSTFIEVTKKDKSAFLFNLDLKKIYNVKEEHDYQALDADTYFTLCFGDSDLLIRDKFLSNGGLSNFPQFYGDENTKERELTNGEKEFTIKNFEVYNVMFFSEFGDENNRMGVFKNYVK